MPTLAASDSTWAGMRAVAFRVWPLAARSRLGAAAAAAVVRPAAAASGGARRWVGEQSWGAEALKQSGEKLDASKAGGSKEILLTKEEVAAVPEHIKALCDELLQLNVVEIRSLLTRLQTRLGIRDDQLSTGGGGGGGGGGGAAAPAAAAAPAVEAPKDVFTLKLGPVDAKAKIKIIKEIRVITGLGLAESKALVEKAPVVVKEGLKKDEAEKLKKLLIDAGAVAELV